MTRTQARRIDITILVAIIVFLVLTWLVGAGPAILVALLSGALAWVMAAPKTDKSAS